MITPPTLEEVKEAIELAWTEATNLPESSFQDELCEHLGSAAVVIDLMIEDTQ